MSENAFEWAACIVYYEDNNALQNLINDLLNQTIKPSHIYISDNDSKISPLINRNEINITIIKLQKNLGFGAAANTAIKRAIENKYNKFILFSQDVLLEDTSCEKMIKQLNLNPGIIFPTMKNRKNNKIFSKGGTINIFTGKIKLNTKKVPKNIVWADGSCLCFDETTFNLLKGFNENYFMYFEDVDFCLRAKLKNIDLLHVDTTASQVPNGPSPYLRSKNSVLLSRRFNSKLLRISVTKRNLLGAVLLFAKFRFNDSKNRFFGVIAGWKAPIE